MFVPLNPIPLRFVRNTRGEKGGKYGEKHACVFFVGCANSSCFIYVFTDLNPFERSLRRILMENLGFLRHRFYTPKHWWFSKHQPLDIKASQPCVPW